MPRVLLVLPLLLAACAEPSTPGPGAPDPAADSVFALLGRLDADAVAEAFVRLDRVPHTVERTFEVRDEQGQVTGSASRTVRRTPTHDGIETRVLAADSSGTLPEEGRMDARLHDPLPDVLPDDPAFLAARTREHYRYAMRRDTVIDGLRLRVAEARLGPDAGDEQPVRRARYYLAADRDAILGVDVERGLTSVLFDEASRATVLLAPGPGGAPLPRLVTTEATVDTPGAARRRYRLTQRVTVDSAEVSRDL